MNMNIIALWEDFDRKASDFDSLDEVLDYIAKEYNWTKEEAIELTQVAQLVLGRYFEPKRFHNKKKLEEGRTNLIAMFITAVFFGMHVASDEYWHWPEKYLKK